MKNYKEYEKVVFDWLMAKNKIDPSFTFSLRQRANKGSELDYFIGTERSHYFATTFWTIPVNYPGSAMDLIDLVFKITGKGYSYQFQFNQTKKPDSDQNLLALNFIQELKPIIKENFLKTFFENEPKSPSEYYNFRSPLISYESIEKMLLDVDKDIFRLIPLVDKLISKFNKKYPDFEAQRISDFEFEEMQDLLEKRLRKKVVQEKDPPSDKPNDSSQSNNNILNQILYGPPGTGKTYNTINKAIGIINPSFDLEQSRDLIKKEYNRLVNEGQIVFTTFHQSMSYEDFIEGIKPLKPLVNDSFVKYDVQDGIFKRLCDEAKSNFENSKNENKNKMPFELAFEKLKEEWEVNTEIKFPLKTKGYDFTILGFTNTSIQFKKASGGTSHTLSINTLKEQYYGKEFNFNQGVGIYYPAILNRLKSYQLEKSTSAIVKSYVLIIDEINRGNISQIFGELITLIEDDKRLGKDEALEVTLPYSKEKFGVPPNLYIIGTMNTADRSVEALDAALRRRFSFEEIMPNGKLIETEGKLKDKQGVVDDIDLPLLLNTINKRIEKLLDKDHQIGHSYFMLVSNLEELKYTFQNKIIPLLQEYFFGDFGKIGLVLGKGFFKPEETSKESIFAEFGDYDGSEFSERIIYKLEDVNKMSNKVFIAAINLLLKN